MIIPKNIKIYFLPECEDCDICDPEIKKREAMDSYDPSSGKYIITCAHYQACKRVAMHVSSQKLQGV